MKHNYVLTNYLQIPTVKPSAKTYREVFTKQPTIDKLDWSLFPAMPMHI